MPKSYLDIQFMNKEAGFADDGEKDRGTHVAHGHYIPKQLCVCPFASFKDILYVCPRPKRSLKELIFMSLKGFEGFEE